MVEIAQTGSGTWHVMGKYTCKHAKRASEFVERKPLDEFEFKNEVTRVDIDDHTLMENGIDDAFCSRCAGTVTHWLTNRQRYLQANVSPQNVEFSIAAGEPTKPCGGCGKPDSDVWIVEGESLVVCTTCKRTLEDGAFAEHVSVGEFKSIVLEEMAGEKPQAEPPEAPRWYQRQQHRKEQKPSAAGESQTELTDIDGIGDARARKLIDEGIESVERLATADVESITQVKGEGEVSAQNLIEKAEHKLSE